MERRLCHKCQTPVSRQSKTGYCRPCFARLLSSDPHHHAKMVAAARRKFETDPEWRKRKIELVRKNCHGPQLRAMRQETARKNFCNPETRARNIAAIKAAKMAHIPEPVWDFYFHLTRKKGFRAAEATTLALAEYRRIDPVAAAAFEGKNIIPLHTPVTGWRKTIASVGAAFGLTYAEVVSKSRFAPRPDARAVCAMIFIERGASLSAVARRLGFSEHSTVIHIRDTWLERCEKRPLVADIHARFCRVRDAA